MVVIVIVIILYYIIFNIRSLRTANSWSESRDVFNEEANRIRAEFDQNKSLDAGIYIYIIPSVQISSNNQFVIIHILVNLYFLV